MKIEYCNKGEEDGFFEVSERRVFEEKGLEMIMV